MRRIKNKITVVGGYGGGNIGDDALMWNVIKWINIKFPNITPLLVVYDKRLVEKILVGLRYDVVDTFENYNVESDVVIYGGGTQFFHFNQESGKNNLLSKALHFIVNPRAFIKSVKKHLSTKKVTSKYKFLLGIGFGPFISKEGPEYERFLDILDNADHIYVRDENSFKYIPDHALQKITKAVDICYNSYFQKLLLDIQLKNSSINKKVAIVLRDWEYNNINHDQLITTLNSFVANNPDKQFDLVFFCSQLDSKVINKFQKHPNLSSWSWDPRKSDLSSFFSKLNSYEILITSRFHGAIFAGLMKIPFISLEIEPKLNVPNQMYDNKLILSSPFLLEDLNRLVDIAYDSETDVSFHDINEKYILIGDQMFENLTEKIAQLIDK